MKATLAIVALVGLSLFSFVSAQCDTAGQAAYINSTADFNRFQGCQNLPGIVFGGGNLNGVVTLSALTTISRSNGDGFGIIIQGTNIVSLNLPNLANFDGDQLRFIDNLNLVNFTTGSVNVASPPSSSATGGVEIVFQNNPALNLVNIGFNNIYAAGITVGGGSTQGLDGLVGTLNLPQLVNSGDIRITNNGLNANSASSSTLQVNLPKLQTANSLIIVNNSISSLSIPSAFATSDGFTATGNTFLAPFSINYASVPSILFSNNKGSNTNYQLAFDNLNRVNTDITISNNAGLNQISFATLQYCDGAISIRANPDLTSYNQPRGLVLNFNTFSFTNNGPSAQPLTAVIGVQNVTVSGMNIDNNIFQDVIFPQLAYVNQDFSLTNNLINGALRINTTNYIGGLVSITGNNKGAASVFDLSGLSYVVGNLNIENNQGVSGASLLLTQLYVVGGSVSIASNGGFSTLSFGNLAFLGSLSSSFQNSISYTSGAIADPGGLNGLTVSGNNQLQTITTGSSTTSAWSTNDVTIINNGALTTVTLTNLVQSGFLTVTNNNNVKNLVANQLTCLGVANIGSNLLISSSFSALKSSNRFQITGSDPNCQSSIAGVSSSCSSACYTCSGSATCPGGDNTNIKGTQCSQNGNVFASGAGCTNPNFQAYTTTTGTLTPNSNPVVNNPTSSTTQGGSGNNNGNPTGNGNNNGNPTVSNSNARTTTVAGTTRNLGSGSGSIITVSFVLLGSIIALFI